MLRKIGNCLCRKHLQNNRKNKNINLDEFRLKKSKPHSISTSPPLTCRLIVNSCHSLAQRQLPQLPNATQDDPELPLLHCSPKDNADVHKAHQVGVKESPK